ncbi:MAG: hypothetical protein ACW97W_08165 [Candidatus Hodarchaeales archaeon]|jgi:tetratricopeptide (TPR) repeat protein
MFIIRRFLSVDPQVEFEKGRTAFENKKYTAALKLFEKSYKKFDTEEMKLIALDNAALSAQNARLYTKAANLYYKSLLSITADNRSTKDILQNIDRTLQMIRLSKKSSILRNELRYLKFLIFLSEKDFDKLSLFYDKYKKEFTDSYGNAIISTWDLVHSGETFIEHETLPSIELPQEFLKIKQEAENIMQRCSLCKVEISLQDETQIIQKGTEFQITGVLTAHAPLSVVSLPLKTGSRGRLISSTMPELPLNLSTGENYSISFTLIPNLPGKWKIGPISLKYEIPHEIGEYPSNSNMLSVKAKDAEPALKISMSSETLEEDFEYSVVIIVENVGKIQLQDISIKLEVPEGVNIAQGTEEKIISSLGEGETFQYEVVFRFDLEQTHFDGRVIRVNANLGEGQRLAKSSIKLGGKPVDAKKD